MTSSILHAFQTGTDVEAFAKSRDDKYVQPFLLCCGPIRALKEFFIICDRTSIPAGATIIEAFDRLFKSHYDFNLCYVKPVEHFYQFFQAISGVRR